MAQELLREAARRLEEAGIESPQREAEWLLGHVLGEKPTALYLREAPVPEEVLARLGELISRRCGGIPLQYLLGEAEFFGERFLVAPGVFIPRPETEAVVEAALERLRARQRSAQRPLCLLDLGTGSGCIAVTLARQLSACRIVAVEVSWTSLYVAAENVRRHGLSARVHLVCGRWMEPLRSGDCFDGIIANPPYVPSGQVDRLPLDVRQEPRLSLDGGADGLRELRRLLAEAPRMLDAGGVLVMECAEEQGSVLQREAQAQPWAASVDGVRDLAGRSRGLIIERAGVAGSCRSL
ncbi:MAG: peptide chain release factor N(5)-glutamine methyltransferase [Candidatus Omnitrophica bacterium]|nr:peptide chain release factor N(5)-glutamine methyltransferase [Candidatus Omnitrophota bacterium]